METTPYRDPEKMRESRRLDSMMGVPLLVQVPLTQVMEERQAKHSYRSFLQVWISAPERMTVASALYTLVIGLCVFGWVEGGPRLLIIGCLSALAAAIHASAIKNKYFSLTWCLLFGATWGLGTIFALEVWISGGSPGVELAYMMTTLLLWLAAAPAPYALLCRQRNEGYWRSDEWDWSSEISRVLQETKEALQAGVYKRRSALSSVLDRAKVYHLKAESREQDLRATNRPELEGITQLEKQQKDRFQAYVDELTPVDVRARVHEKTLEALFQLLVSVVGEYPEHQRNDWSLLSDRRLAEIHQALYDEYWAMHLTLGEGELSEAYRKTNDAFEFGSTLG